MKTLKVNTLGAKGIDLVATPIDSEDDTLTSAQNATVRPVQGHYGLTKRDGMSKINSTAAAGTLVQIANIPLFSPGDNATCSATSPDLDWQAGVWSHDLGLFVVVGTSGTGNRVITSPDGITWTSRTSAADIQWQDVAYHDEIDLFVAVGTGGAAATQVMTSPDGITWTSRTAASDRNWSGVCYSPDLNLFAAVAHTGAAAGSVMTSPDGITWTSRTASPAGWRKVCWADSLSLFVAVGAVASVTAEIATSPDGITWTTRDHGVTGLGLYDVAWSPELDRLVAVGSFETSGNVIISSTDGITWTQTSSVTTNQCRSVVWSPEKKVYIAAQYTNDGMYVSSNGTTWQEVTTNCAEAVINDIVYSSTLEKFLIIGEDSGGVAVMEVF